MRKLRFEDAAFVAAMINDLPDAAAIANTFQQYNVEDMDDGGMGGLRFVSGRHNRTLGRDLACVHFLDADGVTVIATLSLDNYGDPFELDIWKTDFSPLVRFPV